MLRDKCYLLSIIIIIIIIIIIKLLYFVQTFSFPHCQEIVWYLRIVAFEFSLSC